MAKKKNKIFVLDTNVILHDSTCIKNFEDNDIVIPISVLEELDQFKRGNEQIHFNARDFLRQLDDFSINSLNGNYDNKNGKIKVVVNHNWHPTVKEVFSEDCTDNRIINCAYKIQNENPDRTIVIVSKDTNMRLKSRSLSLIAEDYTTDAVEFFDNVYNPANFIEGVKDSEIELIEKNGEVEIDQLKSIKHPLPNESFILRNGTKSILVTFDAFKNKIVQLNTQDAYGIVPRNAEQSFALNVLMNDKVQLVILTGKAGTGKTLLALASALEKRKTYKQIFLARPIIPLSNKDLGFLPGDVDSKLTPYMQPLFDNLTVIKHQFKKSDKRVNKIKELLEEQKLLITPLAYIRGRSLQKSYFIVDEAQNLTPHEVKTIITRAGEGTKIVFTGDINQIDHPYLDKKSNGVSYLINRMEKQKIFSHINLKKGERSELAELASNLL